MTTPIAGSVYWLGPQATSSAKYYTDQNARLQDGRDITVWCSNDYLGMSKHPEVIKATV